MDTRKCCLRRWRGIFEFNVCWYFTHILHLRPHGFILNWEYIKNNNKFSCRSTVSHQSHQAHHSPNRPCCELDLELEPLSPTTTDKTEGESHPPTLYVCYIPSMSHFMLLHAEYLNLLDGALSLPNQHFLKLIKYLMSRTPILRSLPGSLYQLTKSKKKTRIQQPWEGCVKQSTATTRLIMASN